MKMVHLNENEKCSINFYLEEMEKENVKLFSKLKKNCTTSDEKLLEKFYIESRFNLTILTEPNAEEIEWKTRRKSF